MMATTLTIEKIEYHITWRTFTPGASFFVPCLDKVRAKRELKKRMAELGFDYVTRAVVEEDVQGLRVWRI